MEPVVSTNDDPNYDRELTPAMVKVTHTDL